MNLLLKKLIYIIGKISGNDVLGELSQLKRTIRLSESELEINSKNKLIAVLNYAKKNSKFYKEILNNVNLENFSFAEFKKLPILDKYILNSNIENIVTASKYNLIKNSSSGSSGFRTDVYWTKKEQNINRATQLLWWEWAGYKFGQPILQTGITPNRGLFKSLKDKIFKTLYIQAFSHDKLQIENALNWVNKQSCKVFLGGYSSSLFSLANLAEGNISNFGSAVSWGDKLFDHYKNIISNKFNCNVFETYGSAEGLMIAGQKDLNYMYLMSTNVYVEIVDDLGNEVVDGQIGHVIVTNLNGYGTPLIRYRIGDLAIKLPKKSYPSDRELSLPLLQKVIGRDTDIVRTKNGKLIVVHAFTGIFEHYKEIKQFCVIQKELEGIIIEYIDGVDFQINVLDKIKESLLKYIDEEFYINFQKVEKILPTNSGKPQIIISKI